MKILGGESGQATIFAVLSMTVLLGFVGFAADVGVLLHTKRNAQTAADSAAIAGAAELGYADLTTAAAAQAAATQNGFTNGVNGAVVSINNPPLYGAHAGNAAFVEAVVSQNQPTIFAATFAALFHGSSLSTMKVVARAVATNGADNGCIDTLGTSGTDILANGSVDLAVANCSIMDDSGSSPALLANGTVTITASSIGVVGGVTENGSVNVTPTPVTGIAPVSNPLAFLSPPAFNTSGCVANPNINSGIRSSYGNGTTFVIPPGCYNGITINGSPNVTFSGGNYTINGGLLVNGSATVAMGAGLYEMNGGLDFNGSGIVTGTGVTFYVDGGNVTVNGSQNLDVSAPTSGTYNGILFYQNASDSQQATLNGSSSAALTGILYFPSANLTINGSSSTALYTALVVNSLTLNGSLTLDDYAMLNGASPLRSTRLVE